jgi:hypothetical protein
MSSAATGTVPTVRMDGTARPSLEVLGLNEPHDLRSSLCGPRNSARPELCGKPSPLPAAVGRPETPPPECAPRLLVIEDLGQYSRDSALLGADRSQVRGPAALTAVLLSLGTTCPSKGTPLRWPILRSISAACRRTCSSWSLSLLNNGIPATVAASLMASTVRNSHPGRRP